jgi:hypothetical protein
MQRMDMQRMDMQEKMMVMMLPVIIHITRQN